jgi:peptide/nickel transport system permease protein
MFAYIFRRVIYTIPVVFGVALIVFTLFNLVGGDPTYQMLGKHATEQQIIDLRHELGLDQPKYIQFFRFLKEIVTFDFGRSFTTKQPVTEMIARGIGPSLTLMIPAFFTTVILSIIIALTVAYFRGRLIDRVMVVFCVFGLAFPSLAVILFGQYLLAYKAGIFPISGFEFSSFATYVALPALLYVLINIGYDVRLFRTAILDETEQDYVRTARAKGLSEQKIFFKHVLKNSMIPIITNTVIEIPLLILGALLLEAFFAIPGLGGITIDAINNSDFQVIKAMTIVVSLLYIFGNLITDILYSVVDPRVSLK